MNYKDIMDLRIKDPFSSHPDAKIQVDKALKRHLDIGIEIAKSVQEARKISEKAKKLVKTGENTVVYSNKALRKKHIRLTATQKKALTIDSKKLTQKELSNKYGVSVRTVRNILKSPKDE